MARTLRIEVIGDSKKAEAMFRRLGAQAGGFGITAGRAAKAAGVAFAAVGAAAAAGLGSAVKTTVDFDRSMRNVNSIAKLNEKQFGKLEKSVLKMAADVGQKPKVLADGLYDIESSGFAANAAVKVLRVSAKAATAGLTDTATASKAVTAALNAYHMSADKSRKVSDILFQTVNKGVLTFEELSQNMGDLVPAAAPLGVSLEEVGAGMATLTLQGVTAAEAATRMKNAMLSLAKPTPALSKLLKENGYSSGVAAVKALGFAGVLNLLSKATKGSVAEQAKLTPNIRTLLGVVGLTGRNLKVYNENLRAMRDAQKGAGITAQVFAEQSKSVGVMWQKVSAAIDVFKIQVGTALLPALKKGLDGINHFFRKLNAASGFKAKISVVFESASELAAKIRDALSQAWNGVDMGTIATRNTSGAGLSEGIKGMLLNTDWGAVGRAIAHGISSGIAQAKEWATALNGMFGQIDWVGLGRKAGPGITAAMATAIATALDPAFWVKNWDLALALGLAIFGRGIGKLAAPLGRLFGRVFADALLSILAAVERFSPRLASVLLAAVTRLPALLSRALAPVAAVVERVFGKLGGVAKFAVKVLGIEAAINTVVQFAQTVKHWIDRVVGWFKGLPGRIRGAIGNVSLADIGAAIIGSLFDGIISKWNAMKGFLSSLGGKIRDLKGPKSKDATLLTDIGEAIMGGLQRGLVKGWGTNEKYLTQVASRLQMVMSKIQAQLDASQQRAQDRSNQQALADAEKQLAEARKNGKGVAAAERQVQDALQAIRDTAAQRELDRLTRQHDKIVAKLQALKDKAAAKLQKLQDVAGSAFDKLSDKIQRAFSARNDAYVSPAQAQIDALTRSMQQSDLVDAVTEAQKAVADAMAADGGDVLGAQKQLQRAQNDLLINGVGGLADQAAAQDRAHQQEADAQQEQLDAMLGKLRAKLAEQGTTYSDGIDGILKIIRSFDGDFETVGGLLGQKFVDGLRAAMDEAAGAGAAIKTGGSGGGSVGGAPDAVARFLNGRLLAMDGGGVVTRTGMALVHAGETVSPGSAAAAPLGRGGGVVNVYVGGNVVTQGQLVDEIVAGVNKKVRDQGAVFRSGAVAL